MNQYYAAAIDKLEKWSIDPSGIVAGNDLLWDGAVGPQIYSPYMAKIHEKCLSNIVQDIIKVMAKAGKEKLYSHAVEHLAGGIFAEPNPEMIKVANTIGDATNDRIESMFGMLDRQMMIAPSTNPVNIASLISAKQDKPVEWLKNTSMPVDQICNVAMVHARHKREHEGTKTEQVKRRFLEQKAGRDALIAKRRKIRAEREKKTKELVEKAKKQLCRNRKLIARMNKSKQVEQIKMWKALGDEHKVKKIELISGFTKMSASERVTLLKILIKKNQKLEFHQVKNKNVVSDDIDWNSSDEETLDMSRPLNATK